MVDDSRRLGPIVLTVVLLLVGLGLIAVGVFTRDSIGYFASWLVMSVGIAIAVAVPALWRRRRNQQLK